MRWLPAALIFIVGFALSGPSQAGFQEGFDAFRLNDFPNAMAELLPLAEHGDAGAAILVGILYANGYGLSGPDMHQAERWFDIAAAGGATPVMVIKGALMGMGRKSDQEFAPVVAHFGPKAATGDAEAQFLMAWITTNGLGVDADETAGLGLLRNAADGGHSPAQFQIAEMMLDGLGVPQDEAGAAAFFAQAADADHPGAQNALAFLYATGRGVPQDQVKSSEWAIKAGRQGYAEAQFFVSGLYEQGLGVPQDDTLAFTWAVLAANQNFGPAQVLLASFYADGLGVGANLDEAYFWWVLGTLAAYGEYSPLIETLREDLGAVISDSQQAAIQHEAVHWLGEFEGELEHGEDHEH